MLKRRFRDRTGIYGLVGIGTRIKAQRSSYVDDRCRYDRIVYRNFRGVEGVGESKG